MEVPTGLSALEYARHLLENELAWPAKSNLELIADCITSVSKAKTLSLDRAYKYLVRAVRLHKEQGGEVTKIWFMNGEYSNVRPKFDRLPVHKPIDWEAVKREQATPEFQAMRAKMDELLKKLCGEKGMK